MDAEEAEILSGAQARHHEALFGLRGGGLFDDRVHLVDAGLSRHRPAGYGAEARQQALARALHAGDAAGFGGRQFHQALHGVA